MSLTKIVFNVFCRQYAENAMCYTETHSIYNEIVSYNMDKTPFSVSVLSALGKNTNYSIHHEIAFDALLNSGEKSDTV